MNSLYFNMPILIAILLVSLAAVGCPGDGPGSDLDASSDTNSDAGVRVCDPALCTDDIPGELILGVGTVDEDTGVVSFLPVDDGDEVDIVPGWQGGQHIWVVLRATGVETCFVTPRYEILDGESPPPLDRDYGGEFYELRDDPGMFEFLAYAAFVADPERIHREEVTLRAEVSDGCGHLISASTRVVPVDPRLEE